MVATFSVNPMKTSNAAGLFSVLTSGFIQGTVMDSPTARFELCAGILSSAETLPMWGGVGIAEYVPNSASGNPLKSLGSQLRRATSLASTIPLTGFTVFDQAHAMVETPQSPVPLAGSGMTCSYYRLGSGARIVVAMDPSLVTVEGGLISQQVSWDWNNQCLQAYDASTPTYAITSISAAGVVVAGVATPVAGVGDLIYISGATNTGTGGAAVVNGPRVVTAFTDNQHFTIALDQTAGVIGTIGGTILANYGTGALAVKVLDVNVGNSMVVQYDPVTGFATWNKTGSAAIILI
jgi:hypothetical protein